jgi:hypothetical protein
MGKRKAVLYASDLHLERDWIFAPGQRFQLDYDAMGEVFPENKCWLVALNDWQINILLTLLKSVAPWYKNWGFEHERTWDETTRALWDEIESFVSETEHCLMAGCDVSLLFEEIARLRAAVSGEAVEVTDPDTGEPVIVDYTETGLTPSINKALYIDRDIYPDLNIAQVLMKGLVGRLFGFTFPFEGEGAADIFDELITQLDGRFRQSDIQLGGLEKNITETLESLLRDQGQSIFDPEWRPNIANIVQRTFNVADDSPLAEGLAKMINEWAWKLGIPGGIHDDSPRSVAEIMLIISQMLKDGNIATGKLELQTIINILNAQACGTCGQVNGNCTCQDGPSITVEGDNAPQVEGGTDSLLECGCSEE